MTITDNSELSLPESFNIENAKNYHEIFTELLMSLESPELALDLSPIASIDTAGMQLLIAFQQECKGQNVTLNLSNPGVKFLEATRMFGAEGVLKITR